MEPWLFIRQKLAAAVPVMLLYVLESEGSSPGRQSFKMAVAADGEFCGTIGGGIMEHKLVEKAKAMLADGEQAVSLMRQYHDKQHAKHQSGMICSGSQLNAFVPLFSTDLTTVEGILQSQNTGEQKCIRLSPNGLQILSFAAQKPYELHHQTDEAWHYTESLNRQPVIHIIGGGHVSAALSELMSFLGFYVKVYDDRSLLDTLVNNRFVHEKIIVDYEKIGECIAGNKDEYVVIVTFGYRDDKTVLKQLLDKDFYYVGLMGSEAKIQTLFKELERKGMAPEKWGHVFSPIGINIYSKTPKEIAVSIAAEIIREKNKHLPTGRTGKKC